MDAVAESDWHEATTETPVSSQSIVVLPQRAYYSVRSQQPKFGIHDGDVSLLLIFMELQ